MKNQLHEKNKRVKPNASEMTKIKLEYRPFDWSKEHQIAFDTLKNDLMTVPLLEYPDFPNEIILETGKSLKDLGPYYFNRLMTVYPKLLHMQEVLYNAISL